MIDQTCGPEPDRPCLLLSIFEDRARAGRKPIFIVSGDDAYLRDASIHAIAKLALGPDTDELGVSRYNGDQAALHDVLDEVRTLPFLARCRVVVVDGADPFVTANRKDLESFAEKPPESGVLVLSVKSWPSTTRLAKLVEKTGLAIDCKSPDDRQILTWLIQHAASHSQSKLEDEAARLLIELVGPEVGLLAMEVEKLSVYVGEKKRIQVEDVARMVGAGRVETIWRTVDAATTGNASEALADLDRLLGSGESVQQLLAAMASTLRKVHHAGQLRRDRVPLNEACRRADIPSYAVEKTGRQHAHLGPHRVDRLPGLLRQTDLDLKGNSMLTPRVLLERLLVQLGRARQD